MELCAGRVGGTWAEGVGMQLVLMFSDGASGFDEDDTKEAKKKGEVFKHNHCRKASQ